MCQRFMDTFGNPPEDPGRSGEQLVQMIESLSPPNRVTFHEMSLGMEILVIA